MNHCQKARRARAKGQIAEKRRLIFSDDAISGTMQWVTMDWGGAARGHGAALQAIGYTGKGHQ